MKKPPVPKTSSRAKPAAERELIWERIARRGESTSTNLTVDRIVRLAIDMVDREGLEALSMRRIAAELNAGVMSLYYYVPGKGDLLDLILDEAMGEIDLSHVPSGNWKCDLRRVAMETRACFKRHVWAPVLLTTRPAFGPNRLRQMESGLAVVSPLGLEPPVAWRALGSIFVYVLGFVGLELSEAQSLRMAERNRGTEPYFDRLVASGGFPFLAEFRAIGLPRPPDDEGFASGLDLVIEGIAALAARHHGRCR